MHLGPQQRTAALRIAQRPGKLRHQPVAKSRPNRLRVQHSLKETSKLLAQEARGDLQSLSAAHPDPLTLAWILRNSESSLVCALVANPLNFTARVDYIRCVLCTPGREVEAAKLALGLIKSCESFADLKNASVTARCAWKLGMVAVHLPSPAASASRLEVIELKSDLSLMSEAALFQCSRRGELHAEVRAWLRGRQRQREPVGDAGTIDSATDPPLSYQALCEWELAEGV